MPVTECSVDGKPGMKWGESGKCYTYEPGDEQGKSKATQKAIQQGAAIGDGTLEAIENIEPKEDVSREALHEKARTRSKKFGIELIEGAALTYPSHYPEALSLYGDPVNLKYPIDTVERARNARVIFKQQANEAYKQSASRNIIHERIVRREMLLGIKPDFEPDDMLDKALPSDIKKEIQGDGENFSENNSLNKVEIFGVGTWNGFKFTKEDLQEIANNSNNLLEKGHTRSPLKLGHAKKQILNQEDGQPALGWLSNFQVIGDKLLADLKDIPSLVIKAFKNKLYDSVSIELSHSEHIGWFAKGLALLGADLPAVKTLNDLSSYLMSDKSIILNFSGPIIRRKNNMEEQNNAVSADILKEMEKLKAENAIFKQEQRELKFKEEKEKILLPLKKDVEDGKLTPATLEFIEKEIDNKKKEFTEAIILSSDVFLKLSEGYKHQLKQKEEAKEENVSFSDNKRIDDIVTAGVYKVMADTGKDYLEASVLYFNAHPNTAKKYGEWGQEIFDKTFNMGG